MPHHPQRNDASMSNDSGISSRIQRAIRPGSLGRRLFRGGSWVAIGKAGTMLTGIISNALLTRVLPPSDVGIYHLALSIVMTTSLIAQLGLGQTVIRLLGEARGQKSLKQAKGNIATVLKIGFVTTFAVMLAYFVLGKPAALSIFRSDKLEMLTLLIVLAIGLVALGNLLSDVFRGLQVFRFAELFGGRGLLRGILISLGFGFLWMIERDATLSETLLVVVASGSASLVLGFWILNTRMKSVLGAGASIPVQQILKVAWPVLLINLIPTVSSQGALWILGAVRPASEVAVLGTVMKFVTLVSMPTLLYRKMVSPFIAELYAQGRKETLEQMLRSVANLVFVAAGLLVIALVFKGEDALGVVYGDYYRIGALALILLVIGQLINVATGPCGPLLLMTGHQHHFFWISVVAGVVGLLTSFFLIGPLGYVGAALGQAIYTITTTLLVAYFGYRLTGVKSWVGLYKTGIAKVEEDSLLEREPTL